MLVGCQCVPNIASRRGRGGGGGGEGLEGGEVVVMVDGVERSNIRSAPVQGERND